MNVVYTRANYFAEERWKTQKDLVLGYYNILTILDSKASHLMRFNGSLLTLSVTILTLKLQNILFKESSVWVEIFGAFSILFLIVSFACCFFVIRVTWPFLAKAMPRDKTGNGVQEPDDNSWTCEFKALANAVSFRSGFYRWAWGLSSVAIVLFSMVIIFTIFT